MQESNNRVRYFEAMVENFRVELQRVKDTQHYAERISKIENEQRNLRMLVNQSIIDSKEIAAQSVCKRQLDETVLKATFDMLDHIFGENLQKEDTANLDIST